MMRFTASQGYADIAYRGGDVFFVPYHPRRIRWLMVRNALIDVLRFLGVAIEHRCGTANKTMQSFPMRFLVPQPEFLYDRKGISVKRKP